MEGLKKEILLAILLLTLVMLLGTVGYRIITGEEASWVDCAYMTMITIASVGYGEIFDLSNNPAGRVFTMFLIVAGVGGYLYFISIFTAVVLEGNLLEVLRRKKMIRELKNVENHYILCGCGETGMHIAREFYETRRPLVVIENNKQRMEIIQHEIQDRDFFWIEGDATDDDNLVMAGAERARGLIACLPEDKDNLVITLTANQLNENLRIISRCKDSRMTGKLIKSGAASVVSPNLIGGMRMASEMVRPAAVSFLDIMLRDKDKNLRVEEINIPENSRLIGKNLGELDFWEIAGLFPIAISDSSDEDKWIYNPLPQHKITGKCNLVIIGNAEQRKKIEAML
ncbi:MAG: potassium channel protein [Syntrophomonas sp.]